MIALRVLVWFFPLGYFTLSYRWIRNDPRSATLAFIAGVGLLAVNIVQVAT